MARRWKRYYKGLQDEDPVMDRWITVLEITKQEVIKIR
jgi:hypothetical protein